jgi:hypothetical protein
MPRSVVAWLTALLLASAAAPVWAETPTPLMLAARASSLVAYSGEQLVVAWKGQDILASLVRVEHDPTGWSRLEYQPVGTASRWTVLQHDADEIRFDPVQRTGTRTTRLPTDRDAFESRHLPWLLDNYQITTAPDRTLGRQATRLNLMPVAADRPARQLVIDDATGIILRSERLGQRGQVGEVTAFLAFELKPVGWRREAAPPDGLRLKERPGPRPVAPGAAADALGGSPTQVVVPAGFHLVGQYLSTRSGATRTLVLQDVYTDGLTTLVVYQRRGAVASPPQGSRVVYTANGPVWLRTFGLRTLAHWANGGRMITVVGEVSAPSLLATAERTGVASAPRLWEHLVEWFASLVKKL